jgi:hypothetical protein
VPAGAHEEIVDREADLDERRTALDGLARAAEDEFQRRLDEAGPEVVDRHRRLQRLDEVRGRLQQIVALGDRLVHEPELAVLEIADPAVDHVARGRRGARGEVVPFDEENVDALEREIAEGRDAIDPAADDDDLGARVLPDRTQRRVALPDGGR